MEKSQNIKPKLSLIEFSAMMAYMISLVALSIDAMLPSLHTIGVELGVQSENAPQFIIAALFFGLTIGQLVYGPVSDTTGRKPAIFFGLGLFVIGCLISMMAHSFVVLLAGRFLQGLGVAGPRIVSMAVVRDLYEGRAMAKVASFIMSFFIIVPAIAPMMGQAIAERWNWRAVYLVLLAMAVLVALWYGTRQGETLHPQYRRRLSLERLFAGYLEALLNRVTAGYALAAGIVYGAFIAYLLTSPQLFADVYNITHRFPLFFGALAICIGSASFVNARLVMRLGMRKLCNLALLTKVIWSGSFFVLAMFDHGHLPLPVFMVWAGVSFFLLGILFGNINAIAMEPVGNIAGFGSAVVGSVSGFVSLGIGSLIGHFYNETVFPLIGGFAILAPLSLLVMHWADKGHETVQSAE